MSVQIPTKKQMKKSKLKPYLLTHTVLLKLVFIHNHPITSAHALSFRDVLEETKHALCSLFEIGVYRLPYFRNTYYNLGHV